MEITSICQLLQYVLCMAEITGLLKSIVSCSMGLVIMIKSVFWQVIETKFNFSTDSARSTQFFLPTQWEK